MTIYMRVSACESVCGRGRASDGDAASNGGGEGRTATGVCLSVGAVSAVRLRLSEVCVGSSGG
jgi:hypothetical protein